jgi:hypothetical protein
VVERPIRYGTFPSRAVLVTAPVAIAVVAGLLVVSTVGDEPPPVALRTTTEFTTPTLPPTSAGATTTPRPSVSTAAADPASGGPAPPSREARLVSMVGDSVAVTIGWGLTDAAEASGVVFAPSAFPGCGVAAGMMIDENGEPFDWSQSCVDNVPGALDRLVGEIDPDVVVWSSSWELADRLEDGEVVEFGSREHDAALRASIDDAAQTLTSRGARLVLLGVVPRAASDVGDAQDGADQAHYNALLRRYAELHRGVVFVDLMPLLCPGGPPCPAEIDGFRPRPDDGGHLTEETSPWLAERLWPQIMDAARRPD